MMYEDERGTVVRGPWDIIEEVHSTSRGIVHPRVGPGSDTTFLVSPREGATAWVQHRVGQDLANTNQGIMRGLGAGYEREGFMVEMITSSDGNPRMSVGCIYDDAGRLQHVTLNREDRDGWPSRFWSAEVFSDRSHILIFIIHAFRLVCDCELARGAQVWARRIAPASNHKLIMIHMLILKRYNIKRMARDI